MKPSTKSLKENEEKPPLIPTGTGTSLIAGAGAVAGAGAFSSTFLKSGQLGGGSSGNNGTATARDVLTQDREFQVIPSPISSPKRSEKIKIIKNDPEKNPSDNFNYRSSPLAVKDYPTTAASTRLSRMVSADSYGSRGGSLASEGRSTENIIRLNSTGSIPMSAQMNSKKETTTTTVGGGGGGGGQHSNILLKLKENKERERERERERARTLRNFEKNNSM